jgi:hypothetical protein
MEKVIQIDSVGKYNALYGLKTLHPLVTVIDSAETTKPLHHVTMSYGLYALYFRESKVCPRCRDHQSDSCEGCTVRCLAPGQTLPVDAIVGSKSPHTYSLLFHPDLIKDSLLGNSIRDYTFFTYAADEVLRASQAESRVIKDCLQRIQLELQHTTDCHSRELIVMNIQLLLGYCMRFYERQSCTRHSKLLDWILNTSYFSCFLHRGDKECSC